MRVRETEHSMRYAPTELTALRVDIARVELGIIAGEPRERDDIGIGDRATGTAERNSDMEIGVGIAELPFVAHRFALCHRGRSDRHDDLHARIADAGGK